MGDDNADSGSCQWFKHSPRVIFHHLKEYGCVTSTLTKCTPASLPLTHFIDLGSFLAYLLPTPKQMTTVLNYVYHISTLKVSKNRFVHIPKEYIF